MHYVFLSTGSWRKNGTLPRTRELGGALADLGVRVTFVLDDLPYNRNELELNPKIHRVFVAAKRKLGQYARRCRAVASLNPDFVNATPAPKLWLSLRNLPKRIRIVGDWDEWPAIRPYYGPLKRTIYRIADQWLRERSSIHTVASVYLQERFKKDFKIDALYLPHAPFDPIYPEGSNPFSAPTAVYLGTFFDFYDHDILLHAAVLYKQKHGICPRLELIGDGDDLPRWKAFARDNGLDAITFPGHLTGPALANHLRHAHVLLFPMRESVTNACRCPGKLYNYMQAKRPILASSTGEIPRILGPSAHYVPPTPKSFAHALHNALNDPRAPDVPYSLPTWRERAETLMTALRL